MADRQTWYLYILRCDHKFLYTGITTDVPRRVKEHAEGGQKAAKFARMMHTFELIYSLPVGSKSLASSIENRIKQLKKGEKAAELLALYRLICTKEERQMLNQQYIDHSNKGDKFNGVPDLTKLSLDELRELSSGNSKKDSKN